MVKAGLDAPSNSKPGAHSESNGKTLVWTSSTYFAEGLPWSILHQVAAEFLTSIGVSPAKVGSTSLLHGPTLLKVVWSPIVELYGSLRTWMVVTQALMGVLVGALALIAQYLASLGLGDATDTTWIWIVLVIIGVLSATHDIACDGYYMEALSPERQARFSGVRVAAFRAAMLVGSSGLVVLAGASNWLLGLGAGGLLLIVLAAYHFLFLQPVGPREKGGAAAGAAQTRNWSQVRDSYLSFMRQDAALYVVGFLLTYKMADVLLFSMSRLMLKNELGIGLDLRGSIGLFSMVSSILGAIWGGVWISRRGLSKTLVPITILMAGTEPLYALLASQAPSLSIFHDGAPATYATVVWGTDWLTLSLATLVIVIEQICGGLATAAQMVFIMSRCNKQHRTAHFAFATAIYSAAQMSLGFASGFTYEAAGASLYFWIVSALTLPAIGFAMLVPKE